MTFALAAALAAACGGEPWRYDPGLPARPQGLAAAAGDGSVWLSWPAAERAAAYHVYRSAAPGVTPGAAARISHVTGTSIVVTGLPNGTAQHFAVTAVNASGESAPSNEVAATPAPAPAYAQSDLEGTWRFHLLDAGAPGWARGELAVDAEGGVELLAYLDAAGGVTPPAGLFPALLAGADGGVADAPDPDAATFRGLVSRRRDLVIGAAAGGGARVAVLQKRLDGITFSDAGDLAGFGNAGGGARRFGYVELAVGADPGITFAQGQAGQDRSVKYASFWSSSGAARPGDKATTLSITADGRVRERPTLDAGGAPLPGQPRVLLDDAVMSADKTAIAGVASDAAGTTHVLRLYGVVNARYGDPNAFVAADLFGAYRARALALGPPARPAAGALTVDAAGLATWSGWDEDAPAEAVLGITVDGLLSARAPEGGAVDPTFHGQLGYFRDVLAAVGEGPGGPTLWLGLR